MINLKNYNISITSKGVNIDHKSKNINEEEVKDIKERIANVYNKHLFKSSNDTLLKVMEVEVLEVLKPYLRKDNLDDLLG